MCNHPVPAVDAIIETAGGIVLVERRFPPFGLALPGGFVENGETVEAAVRREAMEETGLELEDLQLFGVYSDPERDPRRHTVSIVFTARGRGVARPGDDAGGIRVLPAADIGDSLAFDHSRIVADYLSRRGAAESGEKGDGTFHSGGNEGIMERKLEK